MQTPPNGKFVPKIADIVEIIKGDGQDRSLIAWSKFDNALRTLGTYQSVVFDDAIIHLVVDDMGGWCSFETKSEKEWPFIKNDFVNRYKAYTKMPHLHIHQRVLIGRIEAENNLNGYKSPAPVCIGENEHIALVYQSGHNLGKAKVKSLHEVMNLINKNQSARIEYAN